MSILLSGVKDDRQEAEHGVDGEAEPHGEGELLGQPVSPQPKRF